MAFVKGQSGNPTGRPRGRVTPGSFARNELFAPNKEKIRQVFFIILNKALEGEKWALKLISDSFIGRQAGLDVENENSILYDTIKDMPMNELKDIKEYILNKIDHSRSGDTITPDECGQSDESI